MTRTVLKIEAVENGYLLRWKYWARPDVADGMYSANHPGGWWEPGEAEVFTSFSEVVSRACDLFGEVPFEVGSELVKCDGSGGIPVAGLPGEDETLFMNCPGCAACGKR